MKKISIYSLMLLISTLLIFAGCEKDETPDGPPPTSSDLVTALTTTPGEAIQFTGTINDEVGLTSISIVYAAWSLSKTIDLPENPKTYPLDYSFTVPTDAAVGEHIIVITANNLPEKPATFNVVVTVEEGVSYDKVYAAGGIQWWTWNAEHAYVMLQDPTDDNWFEILVPAWSDEDYHSIKFLGQLAWTPNNWGLADQNNPSLGMINSEGSEGILLDAASSSYYPAYFKVRFNPYELSYTSEEISQDGFEAQETMYIVGSGFPDYPNLDWNTEEAIPMVRDPYGFGIHIFIAEGLQFSDAVSLKFIGQNDGWSPVDVGFDEDYIVDVDASADGYQVLAPVSWIPTKSGDGTADLKFFDQAGYYTVLYDHFAMRAIVWKEGEGKKSSRNR